MKWTIFRAGSFPCVTKGNLHCGTKKGETQFRYEASVTLSGKALDRRGFIVDNADIDALFQGVRETFMSCEILCEQLCARLILLAGDGGRRAHVEKASVQIFGTSSAFSLYEWERGDDEIELLDIQEFEMPQMNPAGMAPPSSFKARRFRPLDSRLESRYGVSPLRATYPIPMVLHEEAEGHVLTKRGSVPMSDEMMKMLGMFGLPNGVDGSKLLDAVVAGNAAPLPEIEKVLDAMGLVKTREEVSPEGKRLLIFSPRDYSMAGTSEFQNLSELQAAWDERQKSADRNWGVDFAEDGEPVMVQSQENRGEANGEG